MDRNEQINSKLDELAKLAEGINLNECTPDQTTEIDMKAWKLYLQLRQPGQHRTEQRRLIRGYECIDEGYIDLMGLLRAGQNGFVIFHDVARRLALLLPKLLEAARRINIYPMHDSDIADRHYWKGDQ